MEGIFGPFREEEKYSPVKRATIRDSSFATLPRKVETDSGILGES